MATKINTHTSASAEALRLIGELVGSKDVQTRLTDLLGDIATVDTVVDSNSSELANGTYGLSALKTLIDAITADTNELQTDLTDGGRLDLILDELTSQGDTNETKLDTLTTNVATVDTVVDGIQTDLSNATDGLGAIKTAVDTVDTVVDGIQTDLSNGTDGLGAIKATADAIETDTQDLQTKVGTPAGASVSADIAAVQSVVNNISNVTRHVVASHTQMEKPETGTTYYEYNLTIHDTAGGGLEDPDSSEVFFRLVDTGGSTKASMYFSNNTGTAITAEASGDYTGWYKMTKLATGKYQTFVGVASTATLESLKVEAEYLESAVAYNATSATQVVDLIATASEAEAVADQVWTEAIADHSGTSGSTAEALAAILADTAELQSDLADGGRLDLILDEITTNVDTLETKLDTVDTVVDTILVDTAELQSDWTNGGRLDLILDELTAQGDTNETKLDTIDTVVDGIQTDLSNGTDGLGALKALLDTLTTNVATVDTVVDSILVDTGTTIPATLGTPAGADLATDIATIDTVVDGIQTDLSNGTDGLGALKALLDTLTTNVSTVDTVVDTISADQSVPTADSTDNLKVSDVLGNKSDAATAASTASVVALLRQILATSASTEENGGTAFLANKASTATAQAAVGSVTMTTADGFDCYNANLSSLKVTPTGATTDYTVAIYNDSGDTYKLFEAQETAGDEMYISLEGRTFINRDGTASKNIYVKITNNADAGTSTFDVTIDGVKLADTLA